MDPMPIHSQYGAALPEIKTVRLEENVAEKIARLNRVTTARDMYDLAWIATTPNLMKTLDRDLIRRLAILKVWVDANGLRSPCMEWKAAHFSLAFDPNTWLRERTEDEFDLEDIGALAVPTPSAKDLASTVSREYAFLANMTDEEAILSNASERDRSLAISCLQKLPGKRMAGIGIY